MRLPVVSVLFSIILFAINSIFLPSESLNLLPVLHADIPSETKKVTLPFFETRLKRGSVEKYSYSIQLNEQIKHLAEIKSSPSNVHPEYGLLFTQIINGGDFYLNGVWVAGLSQSTADQRWMWYQPLLIPLPTRLLKTDGQPNVLLAVQTTHEPYILVGRPYIGAISELNYVYKFTYLVSNGLASASNLFCLIAGLFMLGVWMASPTDKAFGLAGSATLIWAILFILALWQYMPMSWHKVWRWSVFLCTGGVISLMTMFIFVFIEEPLSNFKIWMLISVSSIAPLVYPIGGESIENILDIYWTGPLLLFYVYACIRLLIYCIKTREMQAIMLLLQSAFCIFLAYHDYAVLTGMLAGLLLADDSWSWYFIFIQPIYLSHLGLPLILISMAYVLLSKYKAHVAFVSYSNINLKISLKKKEDELVAIYEKQINLELLDAARTERDRIYQDVHDGIGSRLVAAIFSIRKGQTDANAIELQLMDCLKDLRMVINSQNDDNLYIQSAVFNYCLLQEARLGGCGLKLHYDVGSGMPIKLEPGIHMNILRILQEALTNVIKHSKATEVWIKIIQKEYELTLTVVDNGLNISNTTEGNEISEYGPSGGRGLKGMASRAKLIGAYFCFTQIPNRSSISLRIPLR